MKCMERVLAISLIALLAGCGGANTPAARDDAAADAAGDRYEEVDGVKRK